VLLALPLSSSAGNWEALGPEGGGVNYVAQSTLNPDIIYAASSGSFAFYFADDTEILISQDRGETWEKISFVEGFCNDLDVGADGRIYCCSGNTIYVSDDEGQTWSGNGYENFVVNSLTVDLSESSNVLAVGTAGSYDESIVLLRSYDGGSTWELDTLQTDAEAHVVDRCALYPSRVFVGGYTYSYSPVLLRSTDGGVTFDDISGQFPGDKIRELCVHPDNPDILIVSSTSQLYRSINGGTTWTLLPGIELRNDIEYSRTDPEIVFGTDGDDLYRSENGGSNWVQVQNGLGNWPYSVEIDYTDSSRIFCPTSDGLCISQNLGNNFEIFDDGVLVQEVIAFGYLPQESFQLYLAAEEGILFSSDAGQTLELFSYQYAEDLSVNPFDEQEILRTAPT
jgi:photosystem II stability/assembly factor-like uncharacterized protein